MITAQMIWDDETVESKLVQIFSMYEMSKNTYLVDGILAGMNLGIPIILEKVNATLEQIVTSPGIGIVFKTEAGERVSIFLDEDLDYCMNIL